MRKAPAGTIGLGQWLGVPVRLHASFLLLALFVLFVATRVPDHTTAWFGWMCILIWFGSVVLHEAGHCVALTRLGGATETVTLTPLGGADWNRSLRDPQHDLLAAACGPLANFAAMFASACLLYALGDANIRPLLNPLFPHTLLADGSLAIVALRITFWLNWSLVLVNLLPATPLDGSWALHGILWPAVGHRRAQITVRRMSLVVAFGLVALAWWLGERPSLLVPPWVPLIALAVFIATYAQAPITSTEREADEADLFGYDFSQGYTSLEADMASTAQHRPRAIRQWIERKRIEREEQQQEIERSEERQVDTILARLHEQGEEALSSQDRAILQRVSARYRSRSAQ